MPKGIQALPTILLTCEFLTKKANIQLMNKINHWENELTRLSQILDTMPLEKAVKWGSVVYMYQGRNVVSCGGFKHFFTLWFYRTYKLVS